MATDKRRGDGATPKRPVHGAGAHRERPQRKGPDKERDKPARKDPPGLVVRLLAVRLVSAVVDRRRSLDDALADEFAAAPGLDLDARDKGLARLIAATVLRRKGELEVVVAAFIERPLPADRGLLSHILLAAAAQLLVLEIAPHAVINIAVEQCRRDRGARRFDRLANAVLRRVSERGATLLAEAGGARRTIPDWIWNRWVMSYGEDAAGRIATASLAEAALDVSVKSDAPGWAERLGGAVLATGSVRLGDHARVEELLGFTDGEWWVQDAAAALPARLFGDVAGWRIADLCAAPGGKTAQLAVAGAHVTAVDIAGPRLQRVNDNLRRLKLDAEVVEADVLEWDPLQPFDAVLLDAPCTATGTIRRHPDILYLKRQSDIAQLAALQQRLLDKAARLVRPGGMLVYCTCSLEPEEGEQQIGRLLAADGAFTRMPVEPGEIGGHGDWITAAGDVRTLPFHDPGKRTQAIGMDGFYACRLRRTG